MQKISLCALAFVMSGFLSSVGAVGGAGHGHMHGGAGKSPWWRSDCVEPSSRGGHGGRWMGGMFEGTSTNTPPNRGPWRWGRDWGCENWGGANNPTSNIVVVDDDRGECPTANFTTITGAINWIKTDTNYGPDDYTIAICPGTYDEGNLFGGTSDSNYDLNMSIISATDNPSDVIIKNTKDEYETVFNTSSMNNLLISGLTINCNDYHITTGPMPLRGYRYCESAINMDGTHKGFSIVNSIINSDGKGVYVANTPLDTTYLDNEIKQTKIVTTDSRAVDLANFNDVINFSENHFESSADYTVNITGSATAGEFTQNIFKNTKASNGKALQTPASNGAFNIHQNCFERTVTSNADIYNRLGSTNANFDINNIGNYWSSNSNCGTATNNICSNSFLILGSTANEYDYYPLATCNLEFGTADDENITTSGFNAWEDWVTDTIYTKVLNSSSNTVAIEYLGGLYTGTVKARAVNSTTCPSGDDSLSDWVTYAMNNEGGFTPTITYTKLSKDARIQIEDKDGNRSCSSDNFAIRADRFTIEVKDSSNNLINNTQTTGTPTFVAGEDFTITVKALDANSNPASGFNESFLITPNLSASGTVGTIANAAQSFVNGELTFTSNYSEVGVVDINISKNDIYAAVDNNDGSDYIIDSASQTTGRFIPSSFDITASIANITSPAKIINPLDCNFSYISENLDYNLTVSFDVDITAKNKQGATTKNYDGSTYAKNTDLSMTFDWDNGVGVAGSQNLAKNISKSLFADGVATDTYDSVFNIRGKNIRKTVQNPVAFTVSNIPTISALDINDTDGVIDNTSLPLALTGNLDLGLYLLYARINPIDAISINDGNAAVKIYYEVYSSDKNLLREPFNINTATLEESVNDVNWWKNPRHGECDPFDSEDFDMLIPLGVTLDSVTVLDRVDSNSFSYTGTRPNKSRVDIKLDSSFNFLYHHPYSDSYVKYLYIDFIGTTSTPSDTGVISNEGSKSKGSSRIGK